MTSQHHHPHIQQQTMPTTHVHQGQIPPVPANRTSTTVSVTQQHTATTPTNNNEMIIRSDPSSIGDPNNQQHHRSQLPDNNSFVSANNNLNAISNDPIDNTSRVTISTSNISQQPGNTQNKHPHAQHSVTTSTTQPGEAIYEVDKRGHTSVIRVSYPSPQQEQPPIVTFPPDNEEHLLHQAAGSSHQVVQGNINDSSFAASQQQSAQPKQTPVPFPSPIFRGNTRALTLPQPIFSYAVHMPIVSLIYQGNLLNSLQSLSQAHSRLFL